MFGWFCKSEINFPNRIRRVVAMHESIKEMEDIIFNQQLPDARKHYLPKMVEQYDTIVENLARYDDTDFESACSSFVFSKNRTSMQIAFEKSMKSMKEIHDMVDAVEKAKEDDKNEN